MQTLWLFIGLWCIRVRCFRQLCLGAASDLQNYIALSFDTKAGLSRSSRTTTTKAATAAGVIGNVECDVSLPQNFLSDNAACKLCQFIVQSRTKTVSLCRCMHQQRSYRCARCACVHVCMCACAAIASLCRKCTLMILHLPSAFWL